MGRIAFNGAARIGAASLGLVALFACQTPNSEKETAADDVVARIGEKAITFEQADRRILSLPPAERPQPGQDLDQWYQEQIRQLALDVVLANEAAASGLADEATFVAARRETSKVLAVQLCLATFDSSIEPVTEEDGRTLYEERREQLARPERRLVYHLFKRFDGGKANTRREAESLRDRVLRGENFSRLAIDYSDSEARHREGALGWLESHELPAGFSEVVFALEEGVPSEPVETSDGVHLFYVEHIEPARQVDFEQARGRLRQALAMQRREDFVRQLEAKIEAPEGSQTLDLEAFRTIWQAGDEAATVLRLGELTLTLGDLRQRLRQLPAQASGGAAPTPWQVLENTRRRELLHAHCHAQDLVDDQALELQLDAWQDGALLATWRQRRLVEVAAGDEQRLRRFYESNVDQFTSPPRWHLKRLQIPLGADPAALMARLEKAAAAPGGSLDALRLEVGGEVEDLGFINLAELRSRGALLPSLVAPVDVGGLSAPTRLASDIIEMYEVVDKQAAQPLPFEDMRQRVASAYAGYYARDVYAELQDQIFAAHPLEILPESLERLRQSKLPQDDVSVEELEELLDRL